MPDPIAFATSARFDDLDAFLEMRDQVDGSLVQLNPGKLGLTCEELDFGDLFLRRTSAESALSVFSTIDPAWTTVILPANPGSAELLYRGETLSPNEILVNRSGREHHYRNSPGWSDLEVTVTNAALTSAGLGEELLQILSRKGRRQVDVKQHTRLRLLLSGVLGNAEITPAVAPDPEKTALTREIVLIEIAQSLFASEAVDETTRSSARRQLALETISFSRRNVDQFVTIRDLCETTNVHSRRLERAFRDVLGVTPYQYLLRSRLCAARTMLMRNQGASVTEAAMNFGFSSSSEFSAHYKRFFGETPSRTGRPS